MPESEKTLSFVPVILGANRGAYSLARAFFEEYAVSSAVISPYATGPIRKSRIIRHYLQKEMQDPAAFFETIRQIESDYPDKRKLIFGSDDLYVELLLRQRSLFPESWIIPYADEEIYNQVNEKARFYNLCDKIGVPYPKTVVLEAGQTDFPLSFPVIIKPADSSSYQKLCFKGKEKVYFCTGKKEVDVCLALMRKNGYRNSIIVQEYIAGDDSCLGIVTAYVSRQDREIKLISFGGVVLDDHTPAAIGNSLAVHVREEEGIRKSATNILQAADFYGFATLDVKYDYRTKEYVFLELNARLGSSNYYVTAGGNNVARFYVEDFLLEKKIPESHKQEELLYTVLPKRLALKEIQSEDLKEKIQQLYKKKRVVHPLAACFENNLQRKVYIWLSSLHYYKKFHQFSPLEKQMLESEKIMRN